MSDENLCKLNVNKFLVWCYSALLSVLMFFRLRRFVLRVFGAVVGKGVTVHRGIKFFAFGKLKIGHNTTINYGCYLDSRGGLDIGSNVNISHCVKIYTMGHDIDDPLSSVVTGSVSIGDYAWIFPNVLIMPGVQVGDGAVVYPGSVVTKNIGPYEVCGGNPAKFIRMRDVEPTYNASFPIWFGL